jgi:hypothetical protein
MGTQEGTGTRPDEGPGAWLAHPGIPRAIRETIVKLHHWLDVHAISTDAEPTSAALEHVLLHGIAQGPHCADNPCRAAGVSFALREACEYAIQVSQATHVPLAAGLDLFVRDLDRARRRLDSAFARVHSAMKARHEHEAAVAHGLDFHNHDVMCVQVGEFPPAVDRLRAQTLDLAAALRDLCPCRQLREGGQAAGRPRERILTAVIQHLAAGGFAPAEIADVVVLDAGRPATSKVRQRSARQALIARIRRRAALPDERGVFPYPVNEVIRRKVPPGFRARA